MLGRPITATQLPKTKDMPINVPEEAIDAMPDVSGAAFKVYVYLCRLRSTRSGLSRCTLRAISEDCGVNYGYVATIITELSAAGWLLKRDGEGFELLKGFDHSKNSNPTAPDHTKNSNFEKFEPSKNPKTTFEKFEPQPVYISNIDISNIGLEETTKDKSNRLSNTSSGKGSKNSKAAKGTRLPADFSLTADMVAWVNDRALNVDLELETEKFKNYWESKTGANATKLDWVKTWKNWILNTQSYGKITKGRTDNRTNRAKLGDYENIFAKYD